MNPAFDFGNDLEDNFYSTATSESPESLQLSAAVNIIDSNGGLVYVIR